MKSLSLRTCVGLTLRYMYTCSLKLIWKSFISYQTTIKQQHIFNLLLLQNHFPISTKLGTKHPWVKGILLDYSKERPLLFSRGDDYEIVKIHRQNLKSSSIEPLGQFQPNIAKNIRRYRRFEFDQMERPYLFTLGDNNKIAKVLSRN